MDEARIRELVQELDATGSVQRDVAGEELRGFGEAVVPFLAEAYPKLKRWQGRAAVVFYSVPFARTSRRAFELGLAALADRATLVRHQACSLLAYSLNAEALPALEQLLSHPDPKTAEDARAASDAIQHQNHHRFMDRYHTGRVRWEMYTPAEPEDLEALLQAASAAAAEARKAGEASPADKIPGKASSAGRGCALVLLALGAVGIGARWLASGWA